MASPYQFFIDQGWTPTQSAGIVGNLMGESQLNPSAVGDSGLAYGIAQWHPDRQAQFQQVIGTPIQGSTLQQQLTFVNWELNNTESKAGNWLRSTSTLSDATYAVMRGYERPANNSSFNNRLNYAKNAAISLGKKALDTGIKTAIQAASSVIPGGAATVGLVSDITGIGLGGESCGWFCQLKKWIMDSNFFQRAGLMIIGVFLIGGAIAFFAKGQAARVLNEAVK